MLEVGESEVDDMIAHGGPGDDGGVCSGVRSEGNDGGSVATASAAAGASRSMTGRGIRAVFAPRKQQQQRRPSGGRKGTVLKNGERRPSWEDLRGSTGELSPSPPPPPLPPSSVESTVQTGNAMSARDYSSAAGTDGRGAGGGAAIRRARGTAGVGGGSVGSDGGEMKRGSERREGRDRGGTSFVFRTPPPPPPPPSRPPIGAQVGAGTSKGSARAAALASDSARGSSGDFCVMDHRTRSDGGVGAGAATAGARWGAKDSSIGTGSGGSSREGGGWFGRLRLKAPALTALRKGGRGGGSAERKGKEEAVSAFPAVAALDPASSFCSACSNAQAECLCSVVLPLPLPKDEARPVRGHNVLRTPSGKLKM